MLAAHVLFDVLRELITRYADVLVAYDTAQRDHRDLRGPPADIDDHVAHGLFHIDPDADRRGHGFVDQVDLLRARVLRTVPHGALLHFGDAARNADHHTQVRGEQLSTGLDHLDHPFDHLFGGLEVRDHTIAQRPHGFDVLVRLAVHLLGLAADGDDTPGGTVHRHNARFVHHHLVIMDDQGVGRTEVDRDLLGEEVEQAHADGSVFEVSVTGEDHGDTQFVTCWDALLITHAPARLHYGRDARCGGYGDAIRERKKGIARHHRTM